MCLVQVKSLGTKKAAQLSGFFIELALGKAIDNYFDESRNDLILSWASVTPWYCFSITDFRLEGRS